MLTAALKCHQLEGFSRTARVAGLQTSAWKVVAAVGPKAGPSAAMLLTGTLLYGQGLECASFLSQYLGEQLPFAGAALDVLRSSGVVGCPEVEPQTLNPKP